MSELVGWKLRQWVETAGVLSSTVEIILRIQLFSKVIVHCPCIFEIMFVLFILMVNMPRKCENEICFQSLILYPLYTSILVAYRRVAHEGPSGINFIEESGEYCLK